MRGLSDQAEDKLFKIADAMLSNEWASSRRSGGTDGDITLSKSTLDKAQCVAATQAALHCGARHTSLIDSAKIVAEAVGIDENAIRVGLAVLTYLWREHELVEYNERPFLSTKDKGDKPIVKVAKTLRLMDNGSKLLEHAFTNIWLGVKQEGTYEVTQWGGLINSAWDGGPAHYLVSKAYTDKLARKGLEATDTDKLHPHMIANVNHRNQMVWELNPLGKAWLDMKNAVQANTELLEGINESQRQRRKYDAKRPDSIARASVRLDEDSAQYVSERIANLPPEQRQGELAKIKRGAVADYLKRLADATASIEAFELYQVRYMAEYKRWHHDHMLDGRGRLYARGYDYQGPVGRLIFSVADSGLGYLNQHEAESEIADEFGRSVTVRAKAMQHCLTVTNSVKDYMFFVDRLTGKFNDVLWLSLMTMHMIEQGDTSLILSLDATSSGAQMLAGLTRQKALARHSNMLPITKQKDLYIAIAKIFGEKMGLKDRPASLRKVAKVPGMARLYASKVGPSKTMARQYYPDRYKEAVEAMEASIAEVIPTAAEMSGWFQDAVSSVTKQGATYAQITAPVGLTQCFSKYKTTLGNQQRYRALGQVMQLSDMQEGSRSNPKAAGRSMFSSVIQGCDAYMLHSVLGLMRERHPEVTIGAVIHDCFSIAPEHAELLKDLYREVYVSMFDGTTILKTLRDELQSQSHVDLSDMPATGSWDVSEARQATYCLTV